MKGVVGAVWFVKHTYIGGEEAEAQSNMDRVVKLVFGILCSFNSKLMALVTCAQII